MINLIILINNVWPILDMPVYGFINMANISILYGIEIAGVSDMLEYSIFCVHLNVSNYLETFTF